MLNGAPKCECPEGRYGNPWRRCMAGCEKDSDCSSSWFCEKSRCRPVCSAKTCAQGADCSVVDHRPVCECPPGFKGNSTTQCLPECAKSSDCSSNMVCYYPRCVDPCNFSCGKDALCEVNDHKTTCSCPKGMTGNPLERCRPMTSEDLCSPNPCGKNAKCTASKDIEGYPVASCSCPPGYYGAPLIECKKGDCIEHADCSVDMICRRFGEDRTEGRVA
ncbi:hypothetical protein J437_LFUL008539 [Ladona fulva]|uniref:EGF-like domain-containing protein n=1 Tax=Ladona fulva TaxID=123851 RepID=A0A8K0K7R6_LADFU|nr:hypothetical protein J437_LFUL008539 [Ladona fulva]